MACGRLEVWSQVLQVYAHGMEAAGKLAGLTCRTLTAWRDALGDRGTPASLGLLMQRWAVCQVGAVICTLGFQSC